MRPELRNKLIAKLDELAKKFGDEDFPTGAAHVSDVLQKLAREMQLMSTRERLVALFDELPEPSKTDELFMLASLHFLPAMLRVWFKEFAATAGKELPSPPGGRPSVDPNIRAKVIAYILELFGKQVSLEIGKKRAALRFDLSESTVQRIWDDRGGLPEPDFKSAMRWIAEELSSSE